MNVSIGYETSLPGELVIPGDMVGWSCRIIPCEVEGKPGYLLKAGAGPDAWWFLFVWDGEKYIKTSKYSYSADGSSEKDEEFFNLSEFEKIRYLAANPIAK